MLVEKNSWRIIAGTLCVLLFICIVANSVHKETVPHQITLFLFGSLVAIGIAHSIENPSSSPVLLMRREEARFRKTQYIVGIVFSVILIHLFILTDLHKSVIAWLFAPIIIMPFIIVIRQCIKRGQNMVIINVICKSHLTNASNRTVKKLSLLNSLCCRR